MAIRILVTVFSRPELEANKHEPNIAGTGMSGEKLFVAFPDLSHLILLVPEGGNMTVLPMTPAAWEQWTGDQTLRDWRGLLKIIRFVMTDAPEQIRIEDRVPDGTQQIWHFDTN